MVSCHSATRPILSWWLHIVVNLEEQKVSSTFYFFIALIAFHAMTVLQPCCLVPQPYRCLDLCFLAFILKPVGSAGDGITLLHFSITFMSFSLHSLALWVTSSSLFNRLFWWSNVSAVWKTLAERVYSIILKVGCSFCWLLYQIYICIKTY